MRDKKKLVLYGKAVEAITDILSDPVENQHIESALDLVDNFFKTIVEDPVTYQDMFKLFKRDTSIFNHSANVCLLSVSFGVYLGLDQKVVNILGFGALFHDVGMNRVDRRILEKETPLTPVEWREIHKHPERGLALLKASRLVPVPALRIVLEHHEQDDGSGYPRGLKGNQISHLARICRIVDKFDSMTTNQPFREAFTAAEALKRIYVEEAIEKYQSIIRKFIAFLGGK
jgi:HD-GYP domain-containing protein (c-di-GMP phosphodiesterase class II)